MNLMLDDTLYMSLFFCLNVQNVIAIKKSKVAFIILSPSAIKASQPRLMRQFELCESIPNL